MNTALQFLWDFILIFLIVLIVSFVFINKKKKSYSKLKKTDAIKMFIARYNIDVRKISYKKILNVVTLISSFIISFASTLVLYIDSILWAILVCFVVTLLLIYTLFEIAGRTLKKMEEKKNV